MSTIPNANPSISYSRFLPTRLRVDSLGIGLTSNTLNALDMPPSQYMIVGEQFTSTSNSDYYNLIVDNNGIAVNTNFIDRRAVADEYAFYVDGNMKASGIVAAKELILNGIPFVGNPSPQLQPVYIYGSNIYDSNIWTSNVVPGLSNLLANIISSSSTSTSASAFWSMASNESQNIYYPGKVTVGPNVAGQSNSYSINIQNAADRTIDHSQLNIQNTQLAQFRTAIIGADAASPAILNTCPGVPLEFHASRNQGYFASVYQTSYYNNNGVFLSNVQTNVPNYPTADAAPHMAIDVNGHVGIHTSTTPPMSYYQRRQNDVVPGNMILETVTAFPLLNVNGPMFASNVLIYDADRDGPASLDDLYVRRIGVTLLANQLIPGPFARGYFQFTSNLSIMGPTEDAYQLTVYEDTHITRDLQVDSHINTHLSTTDELVVRNRSGFCNDMTAGRDLIVTNSLRLRGGIWTEYLAPDSSNISWCQIQFQVAGSSLSNINYIGQGISTPGRLGVGINPNLDAVNSQMVVTNRYDDVYELELRDVIDPFLNKVGYIGHRNSSERPSDGSLIIATPQGLDPQYNKGYIGPVQNIYLYPGADFTPDAPQLVTSNHPPPFGVYSSQRVGLNTFEPTVELDVRGSVYISSNLTIADPYNGDSVTMGVWKSIQQVNIFPNLLPNPVYETLVYLNPNAPYVGVNALADLRYGMNVAGGLRSIDGFYTTRDQLIAPWFASSSNVIANTQRPDQVGEIVGAFSYNNVGVGVNRPYHPLDLKNIYPPPASPGLVANQSLDTALNIRASDYSRTIGIQINGWAARVNDQSQIMSRYELILASQSNLTTPTVPTNPALWSQYNPFLSKYQTVIGAPVDTLVSAINNHPDQGASLTVGGNLAVLGDVNITGSYRTNGTLMINSNIIGPPVVLEEDDVFIGGNDIYLSPGVNSPAGYSRAVLVGYSTDLHNADLNDLATKESSLFRVYQKNNNVSSVARFISESADCTVDLISRGASATLRFGIYGTSAFSFMDQNYNPYMSFIAPPGSGERWMGYNTTSPTAQTHIWTAGTGQNMLRLTKRIDSDTPGPAPEMEFEKTVLSGAANTTVRWTMHGPDAAFQQKLSLLYTGSNAGYEDRTELFTFTNNGCLGVGNTTPVFGLDIYGEGTQGTLRIHSVPDPVSGGLPTPQLIFLSGSNVFGADDLTDYRFYAHDQEFKFEQQAAGSLKTVMYFSPAGNVGINTTSTDSFNLTVKGKINITDSIYLNGQPLFSSSGTISDLPLEGLTIFLTPSYELYRGVVVNNPTVRPSDIFHIYAGLDANLLTLEAPQFQGLNMNYRNSASNVWRTGMETNTFYTSYNPLDTTLGINGSVDTGYTRGLSLTATNYSTGEFTLAVPGHLNVTSTSNIYNPSIYFQTAADPSPSPSGNANITLNTTGLCLISNSTCNLIGIGTDAPTASTHIYNINTYTNPDTSAPYPSFQVTSSNAPAAIVVAQNGWVGFGTQTPSTAFNVASAAQFDDHASFASNVYFGANTETFGNAYVHGNTVTDSDRRLKTNIVPIKNALERLCSLSGYTYNLIETGEPAIGLVAQEVQDVFPELVKNNAGVLGVSYGNMVGVLVEAIKELAARLP